MCFKKLHIIIVRYWILIGICIAIIDNSIKIDISINGLSSIFNLIHDWANLIWTPTTITFTSTCPNDLLCKCWFSQIRGLGCHIMLYYWQIILIWFQKITSFRGWLEIYMRLISILLTIYHRHRLFKHKFLSLHRVIKQDYFLIA